MRRLTGFFAALLLALTVSPVMASSTSDSASNDYTATVNSDITITIRTDGTANLATTIGEMRNADPDKQSASSASANSGDVSVTINPTDGSQATFENTNQFDLASNESFNLTVEPINTPTAGEFGDGNGSSTGYSTDNLYVIVGDPGALSGLNSDNWVQLNGDGTPKDLFEGAVQSAGEYNGKSVGYSLDTPDDLDPSQDYVATLEWKATVN